jgi:predicted metal-dependent phosphoesterase TrpH
MVLRRSGWRRRSLIVVVAGGVVAALNGPGRLVHRRRGPRGASIGPATVDGSGAALHPVSMAMHIHGPFSEGAASYEAHLEQAHRNRVDVIWWTDHDFRVAAHGYRHAVNFDGATEAEDGLEWTWKRIDEGDLVTPSEEFVSRATGSTDSADGGGRANGTGRAEGGGRALRLVATGGPPDGGALWYAGTAWNHTYSTCIADTTLELDVRPERSGPDAVLILEFDLSYRPARGGRPAGTYRLRYRIGGSPDRRHRADGLIGTVDVPAPAGAWTRLTVKPVEDVRLLWPDVVAADNSMRNLRVGVVAGPGARAAFQVDRLVFTRARRRGAAGEELRAEVLDNYRDYPGVTHHRAYEISLVRHLNWYGGDQTLPAFPSPPRRDNDPAAAAAMVEFLHRHGGVVCWNHPLDVADRESLARLMIERNALGVDLVEIGRSQLDDLLWVLDVTARNAVFFTAVGSSDDHDGRNWLAESERYVTCAWARSTGRDDLVRALGRGAAWFTDPLRYRGAMDLRIGGRSALGAVVLTWEPTVPVGLVAADLPGGSALEVITGVVDFAGTDDLAPATRTRRIPAEAVDDATTEVMAPGDGAFIRTQVRLANGKLAAVSNPVWLLRDRPAHGVPAGRERAL